MKLTIGGANGCYILYRYPFYTLPATLHHPHPQRLRLSRPAKWGEGPVWQLQRTNLGDVMCDVVVPRGELFVG